MRRQISQGREISIQGSVLGMETGGENIGANGKGNLAGGNGEIFIINFSNNKDVMKYTG